MSKKICKDNSIKKKQSGKAKYQCKKCGEVAAKEKHICKPEKIS